MVGLGLTCKARLELLELGQGCESNPRQYGLDALHASRRTQVECQVTIGIERLTCVHRKMHVDVTRLPQNSSAISTLGAYGPLVCTQSYYGTKTHLWRNL